jgi:hypothetical protein
MAWQHSMAPCRPSLPIAKPRRTEPVRPLCRDGNTSHRLPLGEAKSVVQYQLRVLDLVERLCIKTTNPAVLLQSIQTLLDLATSQAAPEKADLHTKATRILRSVTSKSRKLDLDAPSTLACLRRLHARVSSKGTQKAAASFAACNAFLCRGLATADDAATKKAVLQIMCDTLSAFAIRKGCRTPAAFLEGIIRGLPTLV